MTDRVMTDRAVTRHASVRPRCEGGHVMITTAAPELTQPAGMGEAELLAPHRPPGLVGLFHAVAGRTWVAP